MASSDRDENSQAKAVPDAPDKSTLETSQVDDGNTTSSPKKTKRKRKSQDSLKEMDTIEKRKKNDEKRAIAVSRKEERATKQRILDYNRKPARNTPKSSMPLFPKWQFEPDRNTKPVIVEMTLENAFRKGDDDTWLRHMPKQNYRSKNSKHWARGDRCATIRWCQHPFTLRRYVMNEYPICGLDGAPECDYCEDMSEESKKKRMSRGKQLQADFKGAKESRKTMAFSNTDWDTTGLHGRCTRCGQDVRIYRTTACPIDQRRKGTEPHSDLHIDADESVQTF